MPHDSPTPAQALSIGDKSATYPTVYTEQERMLALAVFAETNSVTAAAMRTGIPKGTIWNWTQGEEAQATIQTIRDGLRKHLAWDYIEIAMMGAKQAKDRLLKGDPYVVKDGDVVYAPVRLRDAVMAMAVATDKAIVLNGVISDGKAAGLALDKLADELLSRVDKRLAPEPDKDARAALAEGLEGYMG